MRRNDQQHGRPAIVYRDTKTNIEALTGLVGGEIAYATDTGEKGHYDAVGAAWDWGGGGGAVDSVNGQTGTVVLDYADVGADASGSAATAETNAKSYADGLVVGLWDDRGSYDASGGAYPSSGGSGTAGAILKGDIWTISVAGTLPIGQVVEVGDIVRALVDTPGNTQANWAITQNNIGYVAENAANKATTMTGNETSNIVYLTAKAVYDWAVGLFSQLGHAHSASDITSGVLADSRTPGTPDTFCARLSLSSTLAVDTADLVAQSTLYLHPYKGNRISLYDGSQWINHTLSSAISLSLTGLATASRCYDIFVYDNSGTLTLEAVVWTSATVRATALVYQDGVEVKASATTKRYVGTVYIDASKQATMEWDRVNSTTIARRHVWNRYNQIWTHVRHVSTASHTYTSTTYRKWNNTDALTQEIVIGLLEQDVTCFAGGQVDDGANLDVAVNWSSGGGELVDLRNDNAAIVSAFTGGGLRRNRIATEGLVTIVVVEIGNGSTGTFGSGVLDVAYHS